MQHHTTLCNNVVKRSQHINITKFHDIYLQRFDWGLTLRLYPHWASSKIWLRKAGIKPGRSKTLFYSALNQTYELWNAIAQLLPSEVCSRDGSSMRYFAFDINVMLNVIINFHVSVYSLAKDLSQISAGFITRKHFERKRTTFDTVNIVVIATRQRRLLVTADASGG